MRKKPRTSHAERPERKWRVAYISVRRLFAVDASPSEQESANWIGSLKTLGACRMGATTVELKSSHVAMLSHPREVLDVIRKAAVAVATKRA
jgi:hypothetical protein